MRTLPLTLLALLAFLGSAAAQVEPSPVTTALADGEALTLEGAVERALATTPSIHGAASRVAARDAERSAARVGLWPTLEVEAGYARIGGFDDGSIQGPAGPITIPIPRNRTRVAARVQASLTDPFVRVLPRVRAMEARQQAAREDHVRARADVALGATLAYLAYAEARAAQAIAEGSRRRTEAQLERLRALRSAGLVSEADVLDAEARLAEVEGRTVSVEAQVEVAAETLATWIDAPPGRWSVALPALPAPTASATAEALVAEALARRPELAALRARLSASDSMTQAARGGRWPSVGAYGAFQVANPNPNVVPPEERFASSWELGVFARWSPNAFARANREAAAAEAEAEALQAQAAALEEQIRLEVRQSVASLRSARAVLVAAQARERAARRAYEGRAAELRAGRAVLADVLRAEEVLSRAELAVWRSRSALAAADARTRRAVGER